MFATRTLLVSIVLALTLVYMLGITGTLSAAVAPDSEQQAGTGEERTARKPREITQFNTPGKANITHMIMIWKSRNGICFGPCTTNSDCGEPSLMDVSRCYCDGQFCRVAMK